MSELCANPGLPDDLACPDYPMLLETVRQIEPPGLAWQYGGDPLFEASSGATDSLQEQVWRALAEFWAWVHEQLCAAPDQWDCRTATTALPAWAEDYGFPDPCEAFQAVCEKVRARFGSRCADLTALAALRGYEIECSDCASDPAGGGMGCGPGVGCGPICPPCVGSQVTITIKLGASAGFEGTRVGGMGCGPGVGCGPLGCAPDVTDIVCVIERVRHAHLRIDYIFDQSGL